FHLFEGTVYGIYEVDGDALQLCITRQGGRRPDSFKSNSSDSRVLQRFARKGDVEVAPQTSLHQNKWLDNWLKRIPAELPKDATAARKWMEENQFTEIRSGALTAEVAKQI